MSTIEAKVVAVYDGSDAQAVTHTASRIEVALDGIIGDGHKSYVRSTWAGGDKQAAGTVRRNERQWSAVSLEELAAITSELDLSEALTAACLSANLCLSGLPNLSRLPKGTLLRFPSGAELSIEEYNPPCGYMGEKVAARYKTNSGTPLRDTAFSKAAKLMRGVVGVVEVPGVINVGDKVVVEIYAHPAWLS
jgi:MOSC domain-containing protein YiiM